MALNKKTISIIILTFLFFFAWQQKQFLILLLSIIFTNLFLLFISNKNYIKNIFLSTLSIFFVFFIIECFLTYKQNNTTHFIKHPTDHSNKIKIKSQPKNNLIKKEISKKKNEKSYFNYVGQKYFTKSKYGYLANPGNYFSIKSASDGEIIYDVKYIINNEGFRLTPQKYELNKDTTIINFYGGSFTFGEGVNQDETIPAYFSNYSNDRIFVNNYGFHGWGPNSALMLLKDNIEKQKNYKTVNILLTFESHAVRSSCKPQFSKFSPMYEINKSFNKNNSYVKYIGKCRNSFIPDFFFKILRKSRVINFLDGKLSKSSFTEIKDLELYYAIIKEFIRVSTNNNSLTVIGILPENFYDKKWSNKIIDNMIKVKKNSLVKIIDIRLYDESNSFLDEKYFHHIEDMHPSAIANYERAKILLNEINF